MPESSRTEIPQPISRRSSDVVLSLELRSTILARRARMSRRFSDIVLSPGLRGSIWAQA
jgi:hypothetical protein